MYHCTGMQAAQESAPIASGRRLHPPGARERQSLLWLGMQRRGLPRGGSLTPASQKAVLMGQIDSSVRGYRRSGSSRVFAGEACVPSGGGFMGGRGRALTIYL